MNFGQAALFTATATGRTPLRSASYTTPATTAGDNGSLFSGRGDETLGNVTSNDARLTVVLATPATITTQPASRTVRFGQTARFSVIASGSTPLAYQWRKNCSDVSGATAASYTTPAATAGDNGTLFSVVASNSAGSATSDNAVLTVR